MLTNPRNGELAFRIRSFTEAAPLSYLQRNNYYSLILVTRGAGEVRANFSRYSFSNSVLCCFAPYQPYSIHSDETDKATGVVLDFHADFFCVYRHKNEVASNGILFNDIYNPPFFAVDEESVGEFLNLAGRMQDEVQGDALAQQESIILYLKLFLLKAIRIRTTQDALAAETAHTSKTPLVLQQLQEAIEVHHRRKHTAGAYAELLQMPPKNLSRLVKVYYHKTLSELIGERLIIEAKRELYLTSQSVKAIAFELGFSDEYYFSRFFKKKTAISPQFFRETVGFAKAES